MVKSAVASLGLFATSVSALGSAVVINQCSYDVYLCDVPAIGGGFSQQDETLRSGATWSQQWTQLKNNNGWSIKLSKDNSLSNIMQYEYTYQTVTPDIIWYDLSDVNGNPWDGDWEVSATGSSCNPKDQAYRFATDDAYGMQSCSSDSSITVTLCSGTGSSSGSGSGSSESSAAPAAPATTVSVAPYSTPAVKVQVTQVVPTTEEAPATTEAPASSATTPTTPAASPSTTPAASPSTTPAATSTPSTAAPASTDATSVWTGPWTEWELGPDGAVIADAPAKRAVAPSLTTFATSASVATEDVAGATATATTIDTAFVTGIAGRLVRRHEHAARKHQHHHNA